MIDCEVATATRARKNAPHCGDACYHERREGKVLLCVVDGLGHGEQAEVAAQSTLAYVAANGGLPLPDLLRGCDAAIRSTRGAVLAIAVIDRVSKQMTFAGIGNIRCAILDGTMVRLRSQPGIVGGGFDRTSTETASLSPADLIVMFTDGLPWELDLSGYEGTLRQDPGALAERLMQDWYRGTDDAGLLICRILQG